MADVARNRIILTAASIVDPRGGEEFTGTLDEALDALIDYAAYESDWVAEDRRSTLTQRFTYSSRERVAEMLAAALLRLAEMRVRSGDNRTD